MGKEAGEDPGYEEQYPTPEKEWEEYPWPPRPSPVASVPALLAPVWSVLKQQGGEDPRFREDVYHVAARAFLSSGPALTFVTKIAPLRPGILLL